jgi:non-specific serine/threonine protein kinase/serine/threonine-protein kinase
MNNLASQYYRRGMYPEAERLFIELIDVRRRVLGKDHPNTLIAMNNLAALHRTEGKYSEAEPIFRDVLETRRRVLGEEHPDTLRTVSALAALHSLAGSHADAEAQFMKVVDARRRVIGTEHPDTLSTMTALGRVRLLRGKYKEAATILSDALKTYERAMPQSWERYSCQALLGASLVGEQKYQEAEPFLVSGYEGMAERRSMMPPDGRSDLDDAGARIVELYGAWKKQDKAAEWTQRLQQSGVLTASKPR